MNKKINSVNTVKLCKNLKPSFFFSIYAKKMGNRCSDLLKHVCANIHGNAVYEAKPSWYNSNELDFNIWYDHFYFSPQPLLSPFSISIHSDRQALL